MFLFAWWSITFYSVVPFFWREDVPRGVKYPELLVEMVPPRTEILYMCYIGELHEGWCPRYQASCFRCSYANKLLMGVFKDFCFWQSKLEQECGISQQGWAVLCQTETKAFQNSSRQGTLSLDQVKKMVKTTKSSQVHRLYFSYEIKQQLPKLTAMTTLLSYMLRGTMDLNICHLGVSKMSNVLGMWF